MQYIIRYKTGRHQESEWEGVTKHTTPMYCPKNMELTPFKANNALLNKNRFKFDLNQIIGECILEVFTWLTWVAFLFIPYAYTAQWQQNQYANHDPHSICTLPY